MMKSKMMIMIGDDENDENDEKGEKANEKYKQRFTHIHWLE